MAELVYKNKYNQFEKRVIFCSGEQQKFLLQAIKKTKLSWALFADEIGVNKRTLFDWRREKYSLPHNVFLKILLLSGIRKPQNIKTKEPFWYVLRSSKLGGIATYKKYGKIGGSSKKRKQKWLKWWEEKGKYNKNKYFVTKEISIPEKGVELSEFVGIMIGDGGITKKQIVVSLNHKNDKLYSVFVKELIEKLFGVKASINIRQDESVVNIVVSRVKLVSFCKSIGLKVGNKLQQKLDIPKWIMNNKKFKMSCLRGLMDTDGCFYLEKHQVNTKKYCYPRIALVSYSSQLLSSAFKILNELAFSPKIRNNKSVQLENKEEIKRYFDLVGTHNPKHEQRFKDYMEG